MIPAIEDCLCQALVLRRMHCATVVDACMSVLLHRAHDDQSLKIVRIWLFTAAGTRLGPTKHRMEQRGTKRDI